MVAAGATIGFGFLAKMLQAFLVLPAFVAAYLAAGHRPLGRRLLDVASMLAAMVVSAGWYLALVEIWPSESRPYIGGSQHDSIVELALGYNGIGRLTGDEPGGLGNLNFDVGWGRLFGHSMGADIAWLLPAAVICLGAIVVFAWRSPRSDPLRAAALIWGGWLLVTAVVFSFMSGIVHPYYTVALAPAVAALVGIGATLLWQNRSLPPAATALAGTVLVTVGPGVCAVDPSPKGGCPGYGPSSRSGEWRRRHCCWSRGGSTTRSHDRSPLWPSWCRWPHRSRIPLPQRQLRISARYRRLARRSVASGRSGPAAC